MMKEVKLSSSEAVHELVLVPTGSTCGSDDDVLENVELSPLSLSPKRCGYCSRFFWELRQPFFGLQEPNGREIDIAAAFSPRNQALSVAFRLLIVGWVTSFLIFDVVNYDPNSRFIWMGYLTHWGLIIALAYLLATLACTLYMPSLAQPTRRGEPVHLLARFTWFLYSLAAPAQIMIVLLYWTLDYAGQMVTYSNAMKHGVICIFVLFDGFVVGNIPIRAKQGLFIFLFSLIFATWLRIHSYTGIGNGDRAGDTPDDPSTNDDALYAVIDWREKPESAAIVSAVVVFVLNPLVFLCVWTYSLASKTSCC